MDNNSELNKIQFWTPPAGVYYYKFYVMLRYNTLQPASLLYCRLSEFTE